MDSSKEPTLNASLNPHVISEVLAMLPLKSLFRFQAVCKGFQAIITDAAFPPFRSSTQSSRVDGFFFLTTDWKGETHWDLFQRNIAADDKGPPTSHLPLSFNFLLKRSSATEDVQVLDSRNGLVLCAHHFDESRKPTYRVCDPVWMEKVTLPQPPLSPNESLSPNDQAEFALMADPASTHHFKVVCLVEPRVGYSFHDIQVFSSETSEWKGHDVGLPLSYYALGRPKACWKGTLCWGCLEGHILVCKLEEDRLSLISVPDAPMGRSLWVCPDGRLYCCSRGVSDDYIFSPLRPCSVSLCSDAEKGLEAKRAADFAHMVEDLVSIHGEGKGARCPLFQVVGCHRGKGVETVFYLWVPNALFRYRVEKRELSMILGGLVDKFYTDGRAFTFVVCSMVSSLGKFMLLKNKKKEREDRMRRRRLQRYGWLRGFDVKGS